MNGKTEKKPQQKPTTTKTEKVRQRHWQGLLATTLAIFALGICAAQWYQQGLDAKKIKKLQSDLLAQNQLTQELQSKVSQQHQLYQTNAKILSQLSRLIGHNKIDWLLLGMAQQVQVANASLYFTRNVTGVQNLLKKMLLDIQKVDDPQLLPVRKALNADINKLNAVVTVDLPNLLIRLTHLQKIVGNLSLITSPETYKGKTLKTETTATDNKWEKAWHKSLNTLKDIVVIRHHNAPISPMLSQEQQQYLHQNLFILLQQAKWAAITGDRGLYQANLQQAQSWLQTYFKQQQDFETVTSELDTLIKLDIRPKLPLLTNTQRAIKSVLKPQAKKQA